MNAQDFCYWLQGYSELTGERPTPEQWAMIREHLGLVFTRTAGWDRVHDVLKRDFPTLDSTMICSNQQGKG